EKHRRLGDKRLGRGLGEGLRRAAGGGGKLDQSAAGRARGYAIHLRVGQLHRLGGRGEMRCDQERDGREGKLFQHLSLLPKVWLSICPGGPRRSPAARSIGALGQKKRTAGNVSEAEARLAARRANRAGEGAIDERSAIDRTRRRDAGVVDAGADGRSRSTDRAALSGAAAGQSDLRAAAAAIDLRHGDAAAAGERAARKAELEPGGDAIHLRRGQHVGARLGRRHTRDRKTEDGEAERAAHRRGSFFEIFRRALRRFTVLASTRQASRGARLAGNGAGEVSVRSFRKARGPRAVSARIVRARLTPNDRARALYCSRSKRA